VNVAVSRPCDQKYRIQNPAGATSGILLVPQDRAAKFYDEKQEHRLLTGQK